MIRFPPYDVAMIDPATGRLTQAWYDALKSLERIKITDMTDVATTAPSNGEVLIWNSTNNRYEPGAN